MKAIYYSLSILIICFVFYGCWSERPEEIYPTKLSNPSGLKFDEAAITLSWNKVENASSYKIKVGHIIQLDIDEIGIYNTTQTNYVFQNDLFIGRNGFIKFEITAKGSRYFFDSNTVSNIWLRSMSKLVMPAGVEFDRPTGILTWGSVEGADDYLVNCYSVDTSYSSNQALTLEISVVVTETNYDFTEFNKITPLAFQIQARNTDPDILNSDFTNN